MGDSSSAGSTYVTATDGTTDPETSDYLGEEFFTASMSSRPRSTSGGGGAVPHQDGITEPSGAPADRVGDGGAGSGRLVISTSYSITGSTGGPETMASSFASGSNLPPAMYRVGYFPPVESPPQPPTDDEDPLVVRGIVWDMDVATLVGLERMPEARTPLGPVWEAVYSEDNSRLRVFGMRPFGADERGAMLDSLHDTFRTQVMFSHPALARPLGVVTEIDAEEDDGPWIGVVYRCPDVDLDRAEIVKAFLNASRFLEAMDAYGMTMRVGLFDPAFGLSGGHELACWGLAGGAAEGLWVDTTHPLVAPELGENGVGLATEAAEVYALGQWALLFFETSDSTSKQAELHAQACSAAKIAHRPDLTTAVYGILAELLYPGDRRRWAHYACEVNDVDALRSFLDEGSDVNAVASWDKSLCQVAAESGARECMLELIWSGCILKLGMHKALHRRGVVGPAKYDLNEEISFVDFVASVRDPVLFDALLDRFPEHLEDIFEACCHDGRQTPSCFALLGRRGVGLVCEGAAPFLGRVLEIARNRVPPGSHPLDKTVGGSGQGGSLSAGAVAVTRAGTATFGTAALAVVGDDVSIPSWIHIFPRTDFQRSKALGAGGFGTVYKAELHGVAVAVKIVTLDGTVDDGRRTTMMRDFVAEVAAHARIRHDYVLLMIGLMVDEATGAVGIVSELMEGGDLAAKLAEARQARNGDGGAFYAGLRARVLCQAGDGIAFLHGQGLIHRDIKPANILLTASGDAKIGDLGFANELGGREGWTRTYAAPEILHIEARSSVASDVYSFALTVYETMTLAELPNRGDRFDSWPWELDTDLPRPTGWLGDAVTKGLAPIRDDRCDLRELHDACAAIEVIREVSGGQFFGLVALQRWDDAAAAPLEPDAVTEGRHTSALNLAWKGDAPAEVFGSCVKQGCNMAEVLEDGMLLMHWAATHKRLDVVRALVDAGVDVDIADEDVGTTALMWAVQKGFLESVRVLIEVGAGVNAVDTNGQTALMHGDSRGHASIVELLLTAGADVKGADIFGNTALMRAASRGLLEIVELLLPSGANVNAANKGGSALMRAASKGHSGIVELLLSFGATVNLATGRTPLHLAAERGKVRTIAALLGAGADANAVVNDWKTALRGEYAVRTLVEAGAGLAAVDQQGWTVLMHAARCCNSDAIRALVASGAELEAVDQQGRTALMQAVEKCNPGAVRALVDLGADVNAVAEDGMDALALLTHARMGELEYVGQLRIKRWAEIETILRNAQAETGEGDTQ